MVTGSAQGIGQNVADRIAAEGGELVLVDRSELVHDVATGIRDRYAGAATAITTDLETYAGASDAVKAALQAHGRIDVLINNVGGTIWARPYEEYDEAKIEKEIRRSLFPTLWTCRAALPPMLQQGSGTLTQALAMEVAGRGVRVVATAPGGTEAPPRRIKRGPEAQSPQEKAWYQTIVDQTVESSFMKRYGTLDEQAAPIVFLASDEASYVTGSVLPVAGGDLG
jgi:dihydroxycyclohexadiene carboxylate dehydrogenase